MSSTENPVSRSSPPVPRQAAKPSLNRDATTSSGIVSPGQMAALAAGMSPDTGELVATLESKLDPDVLTDLTWAFLATDTDHSGSLSADEVVDLLRVLTDGAGVEINSEKILDIIHKAKETFASFQNSHGIANTLPDEYQYPVALADTSEADSEIEGGRATQETLHAAGMHVVRAGGGNVFDDDSAATDMGKKARKRRAHLEDKYQKKLHADAHPTLAAFYLNEPMRMTKKMVKGAADITGAAVKLTTDGITAAGDLAGGAVDMVNDGVRSLTDVLGMDMDSQKSFKHQLRFAEFIHMMRTGMLDGWFPDHDWASSARMIHVLRGAFDTADVDGDDTLEQGEFELVLDTLHMGHDLTPEDIDYCWDVLLDASHEQAARERNSLTFFEFILGVQAVKRDPRLTGRLDLAKPMPWQMLSLLIDTPVSKFETERIMEKLTAMERVGLRILNSPEYTQPMHRDHIKSVLTDCVEGKLHYLNDDKIRRMNKVWLHYIIQATLIGFVSTGITTPIENWATWRYRCDGLMDIDCICYTRGCGSNAGSLGIAQEDLAPGDVTIPGHNAVVDERYYDEYDENGTLIMHAWSLGPASDEAWAAGGNVYHHDGCQNAAPVQYIPRGAGVIFDTNSYADIQGNSIGKTLPILLDNSQNEQQMWQRVPGGQNCTFPARVQADPRRAYDIDVDTANWKIDECFGPGWGSILWFWLPVGVSILACCAVEITVLMYYGVLHSIRVSWALSYRLVPLNEDRAFLADSLVRGAFELGNPENVVYGVDPQAETGKTGKLRLVVMGLSWKGKIVVTGVLMKFIYGCIFPWESAVWVKPWLSMPADMFWNGMTAHIIIKQAQIRGVGVATVHEVFNEIMKDSGYTSNKGGYASGERIDTLFKIQLLRSIGVAIVKHGNMFPSMEVLLRHAVQWLGMKASPAVQQPGVLDNEKDFMDDLFELNEKQQIAVLSVHLLCLSVDGGITDAELKVWKGICDVCPKVATFYPDRVGYLACQFRNFTPLSSSMIRQCFDKTMPEVAVPTGWGGYRHRECVHWLTDCLTF